MEKYIYKIILYIFPILIISRAFKIIEPLYFFIFLLIVFSIFSNIKLLKKIDDNIIRIFYFLMLFPLYAAITSFWSLDLKYSLMRSLFNIFLYLGILLMFINNFSVEKIKNLNFLIPANIIINLISYFSLILEIPHDGWIGGSNYGFKGFANHQNTLASISLLTLPGITTLIFKDNKLIKFLGILFLFTNIFLILITFSRATLFSLFVGIILFFLINKNFTNLFLLLVLIVAGFYFLLQFNKGEVLIRTLLFKGGDTIFARRQILWISSYKAALKGGIFGLGYGISDPNNINSDTGSYYKGKIYIREKGNSTLGLIEETGLFGLALFLIPIIAFYYKFFMIESFQKNTEMKIIFSTISASIIHSQFEAWWVGVGSVQLPLFLSYLVWGLLSMNKLGLKKIF